MTRTTTARFRQTEQKHKQAPFLESVSSSPVSVEAVKRDPAVLGPGYIPGHLFVCCCMIFQCLCSCSASSPPLPGLALFSVSLCEVVSCDDENFSLPESL